MTAVSGVGILIIKLVHVAVSVYVWLIIARVLMSWIPINSPALRPVFVFIYDITEPFLGLFRRLLPGAAVGGIGIDFSPIIAILVLQYLVEPLVTYVIGVVL